MRSTSEKYGSIAVTIHWVSAFIILTLMGSGFIADSLSVSSTKVFVLSLHVPLGVLILLLTTIRIVWWIFVDKKPVSSKSNPKILNGIAKLVHLLFYVILLVMAASGIGMMVLSGAGDVIFGGSGNPLPNFEDYRPRNLHGFGARMIILLFVLHVGGALFHHFSKRDGTLSKMWFGKSSSV